MLRNHPFLNAEASTVTILSCLVVAFSVFGMNRLWTNRAETWIKVLVVVMFALPLSPLHILIASALSIALFRNDSDS